MSTRCQLIVWYYKPEIDDYEAKMNYYHHCDGYPSYMIEDIKNALKEVKSFSENNIKDAFDKYDCAYELNYLEMEAGDIEYAWHLFITENEAAELKYIKVNMYEEGNIHKALTQPQTFGDSFIHAWYMCV